ncbi:MAG TPA: Rab family GTPase, partial [Allocoleopsis sp.]
MSSKTRKMCMIGDYGVGKTSLIRRFVERQFSDQYLSTVGVKISRKTLTFNLLDQEQELKLLIWDIEGQTKFKAIAPSYLQGAAGVLIVADVERKETIEHFSDHLELCHCVNPQAMIVGALNKRDLVNEQELDFLEKIAREKLASGINIYQTSAKTGINVDQIF